MADSKRRFLSEEYNNSPIVKASQSLSFLNGYLVKVHHHQRSEGLVALYNVNLDRIEVCFLKDFLKNREKAFSISNTARLVNRHHKHLPRLVKQGVIPAPVGAAVGGKTAWHVRGYYAESTVKEIRAILSSRPVGQPRMDKFLTNNITPTDQELTRRMGTGILTYTRTEDGRYIPIYGETI